MSLFIRVDEKEPERYLYKVVEVTEENGNSKVVVDSLSTKEVTKFMQCHCGEVAEVIERTITKRPLSWDSLSDELTLLQLSGKKDYNEVDYSIKCERTQH